MQHIILFGLPGAGKTFAANLIQTEFGYHAIDGDSQLTEEMREHIQEKRPITEEMRDIFNKNLLLHVKEKQQVYPHIVLSQTFIKDRHRTLFLQSLPNVHFLLIESPIHIRERRLLKRNEYPLDLSYARNMSNLFDSPTIPFIRLVNNTDGTKELLNQLLPIIPRQTTNQ